MTRHLIVACLCFFLLESTYAQANSNSDTPSGITKKPPYKVLTSGRKVTIQSQKTIKNIIAWSASGNRMVEQRNIDVKQYSFTAPAKEKIIFVLLEMTDGSRFTHKVGLAN